MWCGKCAECIVESVVWSVDCGVRNGATMFSLRTPASLAQLMRPAALAGASGGVVSAILGLVSDSVRRDFAEPINCPTIQDIFHPPVYWTLNYPSLLLGRAACGTGLGNFGFVATTLGSADQSSISCPRSGTV